MVCDWAPSWYVSWPPPPPLPTEIAQLRRPTKLQNKRSALFLSGSII